MLNPSIFHGSPSILKWYQLPLEASTRIDLNPYYQEAIEQCVADGFTSADCESGAAGSYHHMVSGTTVIDGSVTPVLEGVFYVEKDATIEFQGTVTVQGTIVHEGWQVANYNLANPYEKGSIRLLPNAHVTIDSYAGAAPFARGVAILGQPPIDAGRNDIALVAKGFVMAGGEPEHGTNNGTVIGGDSVITGGIMFVCHDTFDPIAVGVPGPRYCQMLWMSRRSLVA